MAGYYAVLAVLLFLEFSLISNVFIDIDGYENKVICILNHSVKGTMS